MAPRKNQNAVTMESPGNDRNEIGMGKLNDQLLGELEGEEEMDLKAKALAKLLQTSDVRSTSMG